MKNASTLENIAEEQVVLGRLLHSESAFWHVAELLRPEHFARKIHQEIYAAIRDLLKDGKKLSLVALKSRLGDEYDDGKSTMTLLTALLRDAADGDLEGVETLVDLWKRRAHLAELTRAMKAAEDPNAHVDDLIAEHESQLEDIHLNGQTVPMRTIGQAAAEVMSFSVKANSTGVSSGFDTGLGTLDFLLGKINRTDLGVIGAARGDAKTILAAQLAQHQQAYGPTALFELEMQDLALATRALAARSSKSVSAIEAGEFDPFEMEELLAAKEALSGSRFYIDDRPKLSIEQIWDRCKVMKRSKGLSVAFIDHFRLIRTNVRFKDKFERMEHVSGELKAMAKDLEIAVVVLSQVTRMSQRRESNPAPQLNDLDGGGALEQDADWAITLFRRDRWLKAQHPYFSDPESQEARDFAEKLRPHRDKIEITCVKRRRGVDGEMRQFDFDGRAGLIRETER